MNFNHFNNFNENMENHIHFNHVRDDDIMVQTRKYYDCLPKDREFLCMV